MITPGVSCSLSPEKIKLPSLPGLGNEGRGNLINIVKKQSKTKQKTKQKPEEGFTVAYSWVIFTKTNRLWEFIAKIICSLFFKNSELLFAQKSDLTLIHWKPMKSISLLLYRNVKGRPWVYSICVLRLQQLARRQGNTVNRDTTPLSDNMIKVSFMVGPYRNSSKGALPHKTSPFAYICLCSCSSRKACIVSAVWGMLRPQGL